MANVEMGDAKQEGGEIGQLGACKAALQRWGRDELRVGRWGRGWARRP